MASEPVIDDEEYESSQDSDFAPEDAPGRDGDGDGDSESSADDAAPDDQVAAPAPSSTKRKKPDGKAVQGDDAEDAGFENSGDEAIIEKGKKRRKKGRQAAQQDRDDEGGEGGLIKTRSMRAVEKAERKTQVASGPVTVDVDALWASMTAAPPVPTKHEPRSSANPQDTSGAGESSTAGGDQGPGRQDGCDEPSETIKIKRTYNFAGKVHTEEKLVSRDSAEARLYLASRGGSGNPAAGGDSEKNGDNGASEEDSRRAPRRAFRSAFEPALAAVGDGHHQRADLNLGIAVRLQAREKARKLNTVEKSRMDWAGFVDKEGIKDELALAGRAKGAFADRQDFLARTEARRDEDARRVRLAGKT